MNLGSIGKMLCYMFQGTTKAALDPDWIRLKATSRSTAYPSECRDEHVWHVCCSNVASLVEKLCDLMLARPFCSRRWDLRGLPCWCFLTPPCMLVFPPYAAEGSPLERTLRTFLHISPLFAVKSCLAVTALAAR